MPLSISVKADVKKAQKYLKKLSKKQLPFATALALTNTAKYLADVEKRSLVKHLDRPTPFTQKAFTVKRAEKRDFDTGRMFSRVSIKPIQEKYLSLAIKGGIRKPKTRALVIPGAQTKLNPYGNLSRYFIKQALAKPNVYTTIINGTGVLVERMKSGRLKKLAIFVSSANYEKRFPYFEIAKRIVPRRIVREMNRAISVAIRTSR